MNFIKKLFENKIDETVHLQFERYSRGTFEDRALVEINKSKNQVKIEIADVTQFAGIKKFQIATDISKEDLLDALKQFPHALFLLTFNTDYGSLTTKQKSPKSPKPGSDKEAKADFCTFKTEDINFYKEFLFDYDKGFTKAKIKHTLIIEELVVPKEYANNPALARVNAKRKGKIKRIVDIDGDTFEKEIKFEA